ncbi:MAG: hypothetical protein A3J24_03745 [Deltaproteobacteria bacterium RIFCSPLOWO2_02_FULL_53_8]|nr:MAG: hypothetical protein A3J24_03745 [Deltaproteobacteria bacterium RIFCSPLOWO2_02_FULL_53_8]
MTAKAAVNPVAAAFRFLAIRSHGISELKAKLKRKGFDDDAVISAVNHLIEIDAVNDERFAFEFAASRLRNKNWGPRKVAAELAARGVSQEIIGRVAGGVTHEREAELVKEALTKWFKKTACSTPLDRKAFAKAVRHLTGRGFGLDVTLDALRRLGDDEAS